MILLTQRYSNCVLGTGAQERKIVTKKHFLIQKVIVCRTAVQNHTTNPRADTTPPLKNLVTLDLSFLLLLPLLFLLLHLSTCTLGAREEMVSSNNNIAV